MSEKLIVTLEAKAGKNSGEAIGTYQRYHLVFLPRGIEIDKEYRVELQEIKDDSRGRMMYRGVSAPDEYSESWKDNGDGTGSRVTITTDWKGNKSEVGVMETRPYQKREGSPSTQSNLKVFWGNDLADSVIENSQIRLIPLEEEKVEKSQLVWQKYSERQEPQASVNYPVKGIEIDNWCDWYRNRLVATYDPNLAVKVTLKFNKSDSSWDQSTSLSATWAEMPKWWQTEQEVKFPVCACGRNRYDANNSDGYAKCEKCREEEHCVRCGKQAKVKNLSGRLVCADCETYESQEQMINRLVPDETRQNLAEEAKRMLKGEAVQGEAGEGEIILKSIASHIEDGSKDSIISKWIGYAWYYFCEDGVYGSKLSPATMQIMAFLPQATGNGLIELVAWLSGYQKVEDCERYGDYYHHTQIKGENQKPSLSESGLNQIQVAIRLRGSEADRLKALEGYKSLVAKLSESDPRVEEVRNILFSSSEQDYALALQKIRGAEDLIAQQNQGRILIKFEAWYRQGSATNLGEGWVIKPDGTFREKDSCKMRRNGDGTLCWDFVQPEELALKWSKANSSAPQVFEVVKLPVSGVTLEQKQAALKIEVELGCPDGFELDESVKKEHNRLIQEVKQWLKKCSLCGRESHFYNDVSYTNMATGSHGAIFCHCESSYHPISKLFFGKYIAKIEAYDKWGESNIAVFVSSVDEKTDESSSDDTAMAHAMRKAGLLK